jgi:hypothetical protein
VVPAVGARMSVQSRIARNQPDRKRIDLKTLLENHDHTGQLDRLRCHLTPVLILYVSGPALARNHLLGVHGCDLRHDPSHILSGGDHGVVCQRPTHGVLPHFQESS